MVVLNGSKIIGERHKQCLLIFCGLAVGYTLQTNLSLGIVPMTDETAGNPNFESFNWNEKTKGLILSAFFWGYALTQVTSGRLAQRYGAKYPLLASILMPAILNIITPWCIYLAGWPLLLALRMLQGMFQGAIFPSIHTLLAKWAPVEERSFLGILAYSGGQFGTVVSLVTCGAMADSNLGWPSLFYIWGIVSLIWCVIWCIFGASSPADHKSISIEERKKIEYRDSDQIETVRKNLRTPWKDIFTSLPFYGLLVTHFAHAWGFWAFLSITPMYLNGYLRMDIKQNGYFSALPYLGMFVMSYVFYYFCYLLRRRGASLECLRKTFNTIGEIVPGIAIFALGYAKSVPLAVFLVTFAVSMNSAVYFGFYVNHIDLAPNFAGVMMGITNGLAVIAGILSVLVVGFVVTDDTSASQWRTCFLITAIMYFIGCFGFLFFGKATTQTWNEPKEKNSECVS